MAVDPNAQKLAELAALVQEVKQRVRAQYPETSTAAGAIRVGLPDLTPLARSRDAASAKMAAIGTVNPRSGGLLNSFIQAVKRTIARSLNWFVRDQVVFNRQVMACVEAALEALVDVNRTMHALASQTNAQFQQVRTETDPLRAEAAFLRQKATEMDDVASHWNRWREEWQLKLHRTEVDFLKSLAELDAAYREKNARLERGMSDSLRLQHSAFEQSTARQMSELEARFYANFERIRGDYERTIHAELRVVRQRMASGITANAATALVPALPFDYARFADRFRGSEEYVMDSQRFYVPYFADCRRVLDLGCGRGEFLRLMRDAGVPARGIESSAESAAYCRSFGLEAEEADVFTFLAGQAEASFDGIFCSQVVEHLPPERLPELVRLCVSRLSTGGILAIETPNPECLAIFATHFLLDPTHTRPVPSALLAFYMEEFGFGRIAVHTKAPSVETMPEVGELPPGFREKFFGGLDYAILGYRL